MVPHIKYANDEEVTSYDGDGLVNISHLRGVLGQGTIIMRRLERDNNQIHLFIKYIERLNEASSESVLVRRSIEEWLFSSLLVVA